MHLQLIFLDLLYLLQVALSDFQCTDMSGMKTLRQVMPVTRPHWVGDGFNVYPLLGQLAFTKDISPFLMLDYAAPKVFEPTTRKLGVGQHPHRGFETVTIAYQV